jgi:hypothetical protein
MLRGDVIVRQIAAQLATALAYVLTFRMQMALPDLPGTAIATIIFIPSLVRVGATLICGPIAFVGLFAGSLMIALESPHYQANVLWHAFSSAASAPLTALLFGQIGLMKAGRADSLRDPAVIFPFIMSYAVINAGLHLIGLSVLTTAISPHLPFFLTMVVGDVIPPVLGFVAFWTIQRVLRARSQPRE